MAIYMWLAAEWVFTRAVPCFEPPDGWKLSIGPAIE